MILLDAYAVIAYLQADAYAGDRVRDLIADAAVTSVNAAEVIDHLIRVRGAAPGDAVLDVAQLGVEVIAVDDRIATRAGLLRAHHYHRRERPVSLADCIAAAASILVPEIDAIATADPDLLDMLHEEGCSVHALPGSDGSTWAPRDGEL